MHHDFENIPEGAHVILHPADANLIHREPVKATRLGDYFYCDRTYQVQMGADYWLGEVAAFMRGYEPVGVVA